MSIARADFDYLRNFLRENAAIVLDSDKEYLAETRLTPLAHHEGFNSIEALMGSLRTQRADLRRKVLDAMTNNETWFFRDLVPFEALRHEVLPALIKARGTEKKLRIWSAASSTGQEPYSIAMMWQEHFRMPNWELEILATDISETALNRARNGRYSQMEVNRGLPITLLTKYFRRNGLDWELVPDMRSRVNYRSFNLSQPWPPLPKMDIIFVRNVMIYFDIEIRKQILARVRSLLQPDGVLFLGCAETTLNLDSGFERIAYGKTAYHRLKH